MNEPKNDDLFVLLVRLVNGVERIADALHEAVELLSQAARTPTDHVE